MSYVVSVVYIDANNMLYDSDLAKHVLKLAYNKKAVRKLNRFFAMLYFI